MTMQAWEVRGYGRPDDVLANGPRAVPVPTPGRFLVRVLAAAVGLPDAKMCAASYAFSPPLPFVPGQEVCGIVESSGGGTEIPIGARIMGVTDFFEGNGGFAEYCIVGESSAFIVPDSMDDECAAAFRIGFSTAWVGLVRRARMLEGETVLVLGAAGGSGAGAVELAKALGAHVVAVVAGDAKSRFVSDLGADVVIDRTRGSIVDAVRTATGGRGVDIVYDPVGGGLAADAMRAIARGGRFLAVGFASGTWAVPDTPALVRGDWSFLGVYAGSTTREENEDDHRRMLELFESGRLRPRVHSVGFDAVARAVQSLADADACGKTVVRIHDAGTEG